MRFHTKEKAKEVQGNMKSRDVFLFLPRKIGIYIYWLEYVNCTFEYKSVMRCTRTGRVYYRNKWVLTRTKTKRII